MIGTGTSGYAAATVGTSPYLREFWNRTLLARNIPNWIYRKGAKMASIPRGSGTQMNFRRRNRPVVVAAGNHTLTEGVTPAPIAGSYTRVPVTLGQYGGYMVTTDLVDVTAYDPIVDGNVTDLAIFSSEVMDYAMRDVVAAATNVIYAGGKTSRGALASGDVINDATLKQVRSFFAKKAVPRFPDGTYHGLIPTDATYDLMGTNLFINAAYYQKDDDARKGVTHPLYGISFEETPIVIKYVGAGASSVDVYRAIFFAPDAFAAVDIEGLGLENIIKPVGSSGVADALNQRGSQGTKWTDAGVILDQDRILAVEFVPGYAAP